ncbi:MAG: class A beta-lactamase [Gluconacetobacter diazotrophicus]|nr:class A beta-lactamase [Gluconacetobacter diazotrophicus]
MALLAAHRARAAGGDAGGDGGGAIAAIERRHGGRLGVFVLDVGSGRTLAHRADERFLLQSTFKGFLAAMVLRRVADGRDRLDEELSYGRPELLPTSPVTEAAVAQGRLSIERLCAAILERSDNTAANLLLRHVGGPAALTAYVRGLGDPVTRFDRYELIGGRDGDEDTSTPRAVATTARTLLLGTALPVAERARLEGWMANNLPGRNRLRAAFPKDWAACDRTGTSDGVCNDYALARRPGRGALVMAAYYEAPGMEMPAQEAALREVGAAIVGWAG